METFGNTSMSSFLFNGLFGAWERHTVNKQIHRGTFCLAPLLSGHQLLFCQTETQRMTQSLGQQDSWDDPWMERQVLLVVYGLMCVTNAVLVKEANHPKLFI